MSAATRSSGNGQRARDIYSFVDTAGVMHFSNVPADTRYRLLLAAPAEEKGPHRADRAEVWLRNQRITTR